MVAAEVVEVVVVGGDDPAPGFACLNLYLLSPQPTQGIRRRVHLEHAGCARSHCETSALVSFYFLVWATAHMVHGLGISGR